MISNSFLLLVTIFGFACSGGGGGGEDSAPEEKVAEVAPPIAVVDEAPEPEIPEAEKSSPLEVFELISPVSNVAPDVNPELRFSNLDLGSKVTIYSDDQCSVQVTFAPQLRQIIMTL